MLSNSLRQARSLLLFQRIVSDPSALGGNVLPVKYSPHLAPK